MTVFCIGDVNAKRTAFRTSNNDRNRISIDNDEVLCTVNDGDSTYFLVGSTPFSDMTVSEYISYQRSLINCAPTNEKEIRYYAKLFSFTLPLNVKMKRLNLIQYRVVQFISRLTLPVKEVYINLDGYEYGTKNAKRLKEFLQKLENYFPVFVAVSDYRFIPQGGAIRQYSSNGEYCEIKASAFICKKSDKRKLPIGEEENNNEKLKTKKITVALN